MNSLRSLLVIAVASLAFSACGLLPAHSDGGLRPLGAAEQLNLESDTGDVEGDGLPTGAEYLGWPFAPLAYGLDVILLLPVELPGYWILGDDDYLLPCAAWLERQVQDSLGVGDVRDLFSDE